ncbi:hypothetical protein [Selenomonas sp. GACV-9]|uniref:hypothetical protein n=1 Tax=Selenomonas sp. GACV-9 TaxID=3158782 RepID=UPI0015A5F3A3
MIELLHQRGVRSVGQILLRDGVNEGDPAFLACEIEHGAGDELDFAAMECGGQCIAGGVGADAHVPAVCLDEELQAVLDVTAVQYADGGAVQRGAAFGGNRHVAVARIESEDCRTGMAVREQVLSGREGGSADRRYEVELAFLQALEAVGGCAVVELILPMRDFCDFGQIAAVVAGHQPDGIVGWAGTPFVGNTDADGLVGRRFGQTLRGQHDQGHTQQYTAYLC